MYTSIVCLITMQSSHLRDCQTPDWALMIYSQKLAAFARGCIDIQNCIFLWIIIILIINIYILSMKCSDFFYFEKKKCILDADSSYSESCTVRRAVSFKIAVPKKKKREKWEIEENMVVWSRKRKLYIVYRTYYYNNKTERQQFKVVYFLFPCSIFPFSLKKKDQRKKNIVR